MNVNILQIKEWMISKSPDVHNFDGDFNVIENGVLDSFQFLELVYLIENLSGQVVDISKTCLNDYSTLNKIESKFFTK